MELTLSCFNCNQELPNKENYYFCLKCLTQIRCKNCNELLLKDAIGCINCGTPIKETQSYSGAINTVEFEQKGNNKKFVANFTDHVGENLVASLGGLFLSPNPNKSNQNPFIQVRGVQLPLVSGKKESPAAEYTQVIDAEEDDLNTALTKIFKTEEDKLVLINQRLKQNGKRDHAIRIALVSLYAYTLTGKPQIKRNSIAEILQSAAVHDNNYLTWLSKCDEIKKVDNELLELNLPGRDAAIEILKEFVNSSVERGNVNFSATSGKSGKAKGKKNKGDSTGNVEVSSPKTGNTSSRMSPVKMIDILIADKYFLERKRVPEIIKYCKDVKGQTLSTNSVSVVMLRKVKSNSLKREINPSDNQYEYYQ